MSSELPDLDEAISFAVDNGAQAGPFSMRSIVDSVKQGQRLPSTLVWWAGEPDWVPFNSVPGLVALTQDPVETLPPPPSGDPVFGGAAPAGAADATMTFGAAAAAQPAAADPALADPAPAAEPVVDVFEPQASADAGFADGGAPGDVLEMGGEIDATQAWSTADAIEPEANLVEAEGADFSWASPEPGATDDVWADVNQGAAEAAPAAEPESTDTGGLSTGLFGAGAGAVAAAGAAAGGIFASGSDAVEDVVPDGVDLGGVAEAMPDTGDLGGTVADVMPDGAGLAASVGGVMPEGVSPLESVNERIEALGADSPIAGAEVAPVAEAVEEVVAAEPVAAQPEPVAAVHEEPAVEMADPAPATAEEPVVVEEPMVAEAPAGAFVAAEPVVDTESVAAEASVEDGRSVLFNELLDRSAAVEASEMRADRKIVVLLAGVMNVAAHRSLAVLDMVATGLQHSVRFENPADGTRTTVALGNAGDHVRMAFGFGTPVADPESVLTSTAWDDGPIMIGADTDDGLAFTGVDLYIDPSDYVTATNTVDAEALGSMFDALTHELRSSLLFGLED